MKEPSLKGYFRSHLLDFALVVAGGIIAIITIYCDLVSLYDKPPLLQYRILCQWRKPGGMSILPPHQYYFNPPGGYLEPLSFADVFSLYFPLVYFALLIIEGLRYYRWKRSSRAVTMHERGREA